MPRQLEPRIDRLDPPAEGVAVLELAGELDLAVGARMRELVDEIAAERPQLVVADMSEVGFMDSTMLRELLRAHQIFQETGVRLVLAGAQPAVQRLLELTGTDTVFALTESREAALSA